MLILFLQGWQSTPGGIKPTYLKDHGHAVLNPKLPGDDFDAAVEIAQAELDWHRPAVVVGYSRGGSVAMNLKTEVPLVLLCPAWKRWGAARTVKPGTTILHSPADDVIPFADSEELVRNSGLPESALIVVGHEHRLADSESLRAMLEAVDRVPARVQFGIGVLLVIMTMYAVLFGVLQAFRASPLDFVVITLFLTTVALGQKFLFKGRQPRKASIIVGACFFVGLYIVLKVVFGLSARNPYGPLDGAFLGAIAGYLAGLPISGVFLAIDKLRTRQRRSKGTD